MSEQLASPTAAPQGLPPGMEGLPPGADMAMVQALPEHGVNLPEYGVGLPEYGVDLPEHGVNLPEYGVSEIQGANMNGETTGSNPINPAYEQVASQCETPSQLRDAVYEGMYSELQDRAANNPTPTEQEMRMGAYKEEIEPQARDAVMSMRDKGYNTSSSGFGDPADGHETQQLTLRTPLSAETETTLKAQGFSVENISLKQKDNTESNLTNITFQPNNPMNLGEMKSRWDQLAGMLPDRGQPAPMSAHGSAEKFREAVRSNTLQDYVQNWEYKPSQAVNQGVNQEKVASDNATPKLERQDFSHTETETQKSRPNSIRERIQARVEKEVEGLIIKIGDKAVEGVIRAELGVPGIALDLAKAEGEPKQSGRIDDPAKAEVMAYASKAQEEEVVKANKAADEAAQHIGISDNWRSKQYLTAGSEQHMQQQRAERARQAANQLAQAAGETYDKLHQS